MQYMRRSLSQFSLMTVVFLVLSSCTYVNTRRAVADRGRQCTAIILPDQENLVLYRSNGKLYLQGIRTEVRRAGRDKVNGYSAQEFSSGQYIPRRKAPRSYAYREVQPADIIKGEVFALNPARSIPSGATPVYQGNRIVAYKIDTINCNPYTTRLQHGWQSTLPRHAKQVKLPLISSEHQRVGQHLSNSRCGFVIPIGSMRANAHAVYAYPLAGVSAIAIDLPGTLLANTLVPAISGLAALPASIYQKTRLKIQKADSAAE